MADFSDLVPGLAKPSLVDGDGNLKPSITTDAYVGGVPWAANQVKASVVHPNGEVKSSFFNHHFSSQISYPGDAIQPLSGAEIDQLLFVRRRPVGSTVFDERVGLGDRVNWADYGEQFDQWTDLNVTVATDQIGNPLDLTVDADSMTDDATSGHHQLASNTVASGIEKVTLSVYAKDTGSGAQRYLVLIPVNASGRFVQSNSLGFSCFDLRNGTVTQDDPNHLQSSSIENIGGGWYKCSATVLTLSGGTTSAVIRMSGISTGLNDTCSNAQYSGDGVSSFYLWGAELNLGEMPSNGTLKQSNCLVLDGAGDHVRIPDNTDLDITDFLSVSIRAKSDIADIVTTSDQLISRHDYGTTERQWTFGLDVDEKLSVLFGDVAGSHAGDCTSDSAVAIDSWHTYGFTFEGGTVKLYLDGFVVASTSTTVPATLNTLGPDLTLGCYLNSGAAESLWDGDMCDARIYAGDSSVLSDAQMLALHKGALKTVPGGQTLAAHYKLSEGGGLIAYDSANENYGDVVGTWGLQDVYHANIINGFDQVATFDGVNDYVNVNQVDVAGGSRSICLWVNSKQTGTYHYLIDGNTDRVVLAWNTSTGNQLGAYVVNGWHNFGVAPSDGEWHSIVFVIDGTDAIMYLDGVQFGVTKTVTASSWASLSLLKIGSDNGGTGSYFQGLISEFRIYPTALTASDAAEFHSGALSDDDAEAHWKFKDGLTTTAVDSSPNGYDGIITGATAAQFWATKIPTDSAELSVITGTSPNHACGSIHNGAETQVGLIEGDWSFHDPRTNPYFNRERTETGVVCIADRFASYDTALAGDDLALVSAYVASIEDG